VDVCEQATQAGFLAPGPDLITEEMCAFALRVMRSDRELALPGFPGFYMPPMPVDRHPRATLFEEPDNPQWSRPMESRILSESAAIIDFPIYTLHAVCRTSICGVIYVYDNAAWHGGTYNRYAEQLADELGFAGFHAGVSMNPRGSSFMIIYMGDWPRPRLP
jgi:hypothetical protein